MYESIIIITMQALYITELVIYRGVTAVDGFGETNQPKPWVSQNL